jgi:hypothetical protein
MGTVARRGKGPPHVFIRNLLVVAPEENRTVMTTPSFPVVKGFETSTKRSLTE